MTEEVFQPTMDETTEAASLLHMAAITTNIYELPNGLDAFVVFGFMAFGSVLKLVKLSNTAIRDQIIDRHESTGHVLDVIRDSMLHHIALDVTLYQGEEVAKRLKALGNDVEMGADALQALCRSLVVGQAVYGQIQKRGLIPLAPSKIGEVIWALRDEYLSADTMPNYLVDKVIKRAYK